jgi:uncharacterized protein
MLELCAWPIRLIRMKRDAAPARLDVIDFAATAVALAGEEPVAAYPRLAMELAAPDPQATADAGSAEPPAPPSPLVRWDIVGESRPGATGAPVPWLHLDAEAVVPLVCQRCLAPVDTTLRVDRWFRFAPDEATAAQEDDVSEEDVLVAERDFDLRGLIEDELLMDIPITPRHEVCPEPVRLSAADEGFDAGEEGERANPFAVLGKLRSPKP